MGSTCQHSCLAVETIAPCRSVKRTGWICGQNDLQFFNVFVYTGILSGRLVNVVKITASGVCLGGGQTTSAAWCRHSIGVFNSRGLFRNWLTICKLLTRRTPQINFLNSFISVCWSWSALSLATLVIADSCADSIQHPNKQLFAFLSLHPSVY